MEASFKSPGTARIFLQLRPWGEETLVSATSTRCEGWAVAPASVVCGWAAGAGAFVMTVCGYRGPGRWLWSGRSWPGLP